MNKINFLENTFPQMILMTMMLMIILIFSSQSHHPIILNILIIIYTIILSILMSFWSFNFMFSFMLILMMISGLLIIFLYFSSLIANEKNKKFSWKLSLMLMLTMNLLWLSTNLNIYLPPHKYLETLNLTHINEMMFNNIQKIYYYPYNNMTLLTMIYLLLALFLIIKTCSYKSSSLRKIS